MSAKPRENNSLDICENENKPLWDLATADSVSCGERKTTSQGRRGSPASPYCPPHPHPRHRSLSIVFLVPSAQAELQEAKQDQKAWPAGLCPQKEI